LARPGHEQSAVIGGYSSGQGSVRRFAGMSASTAVAHFYSHQLSANGGFDAATLPAFRELLERLMH